MLFEARTCLFHLVHPKKSVQITGSFKNPRALAIELNHNSLPFIIFYRLTIEDLLNISKRWGKVKDQRSKGKHSENWEKVSSEVLYVGSNKVCVLCNVGNSDVRSLHHHLWCLWSSERSAGYYGDEKVVRKVA